MDAKSALKNDSMVVLIYDHGKREISIEDGDVISVGDARELFSRVLVADCNGAMTRLHMSDYDMGEVEAFYRNNQKSHD